MSPAIRHRMTRVARIAGWDMVVPALRARARRRLPQLQADVATVVTINWSSWTHLEVLLDVVRRRSPGDTRLLVVDNHSEDDSRQQLAQRRDVGSILLPVNVGHDLALDVGVLSAATEYVITLDVDAFPLRDRWLDDLLAPLSAGAQVSGARLNRQYVHPCCWAMRTERFVSRGHSFRSHYQPRAGGRDASGDVGEEISAREAPHLYFFDISSQRGPGDIGTVFGDLVYHNFYATRFRATAERTLDGGVISDDPEQAWEEALRRYVR